MSACKAGQIRRVKSDLTGQVVQLVENCTCGEHQLTANGWTRKSAPVAVQPEPQQKVLTPSGAAVPLEKGGSLDVLESRDAMGRGSVVMVPRPYYKTEKGEQ